jgi:hypothetical protein
MSHEDTPAEYADPELTPARDARDSTNFLVADQPDEHGSRIKSLPILSLLLYCIHRLGSPSSSSLASDPVHEVALIVLIAMLQNGGDAFAEDFPTVPRYRYGPLLVAAENSLRLAQSYRPAGADGSGPHPSTPPPAGTLRNVLGDDIWIPYRGFYPVYTWYIPGISHFEVFTWYIPGISRYIPGILR